MLEIFKNYLSLTQNVWATWVGMENLMDPNHLGKILARSFLQDIAERLLSSEYACIEFKNVGVLRRNERGVHFDASDIFAHEKEQKEGLLHGKFWHVLCKGETIVTPPYFVSLYKYGDTEWLGEVAVAMLKAIQYYDPLLRHVFMGTLWNGMSAGVHDAICLGKGMWLEGIGVLEVDRFIINDNFQKKIAASVAAAVNHSPGMYCQTRGSRYRNRDQAWYRSDG